MGRTFVTFEEAAKILNCTKRTVHNFVRRGQLRREYELDSVVLSRADVEALAEERGSGLPALNNRTLKELMSRLSNVEMQLSVFRKMHGLSERQWFRPSDVEAQSLHSMAKHFLTKNSFSTQEIGLWAGTFNRFDELSFDLMKQALGSDTFWKDFFDLCLKLMEFVSNPKRGKQLRELSRLDLELSLGLKNMRGIILTWIELGHGKTTTQLMKSLGTGKDDVVRRLNLS